MRKALLAALVALALGGCAELQNDHMRRSTVGQVPCAESEITIERGSTDGFGGVTWTAHCRGRVFHCSQTAGGPTMARTYSYACRERN